MIVVEGRFILFTELDSRGSSKIKIALMLIIVTDEEFGRFICTSQSRVEKYYILRPRLHDDYIYSRIHSAYY